VLVEVNPVIAGDVQAHEYIVIAALVGSILRD
jgi:hypothetical protein